MLLGWVSVLFLQEKNQKNSKQNPMQGDTLHGIFNWNFFGSFFAKKEQRHSLQSIVQERYGRFPQGGVQLGAERRILGGIVVVKIGRASCRERV